MMWTTLQLSSESINWPVLPPNDPNIPSLNRDRGYSLPYAINTVLRGQYRKKIKRILELLTRFFSEARVMCAFFH